MNSSQSLLQTPLSQAPMDACSGTGAARKPQLFSVDPDSGPEVGGTLVIISGKNLGCNKTDLDAITIVGQPCAEMDWLNNTTVQCKTTPKENGGKGPVIVRTLSGGESTEELLFTYNYAPHIATFEPRSGPAAGDTMVNITGHHFGEVETDLVGVWLSGVPCRTYRWINGRQVLCESAALPRQSGKYHSGPVIVQTLTGGKGSSTAENSTLQWTYNSQSGPEAGGTVLLLTGSNLGQDELDLLSITIADGRPCTSIKWTSSAVVHCVTAPARSEGGGYIDEPINGPIVITTRSGGRWAADWSPSINFTYNPSPLVTYVFPNTAVSPSDQLISIQGFYLGRSLFDIQSIDLAGQVCRPLSGCPSPTNICCQLIADGKRKMGPIKVTTKSGGEGRPSNVTFTLLPLCKLYTSPDSCRYYDCHWCDATTVCVDSAMACPARCLMRPTEQSCQQAGGGNHCFWCPSTTTCLDRQQDCPSSCFLHRSEAECTSPIAQSHQCVWCPVTASCLSTPRAASSSEEGSNSRVVKMSSCPTNCSLAPGLGFSCGSMILLVLVLTTIAVLVFGLWLITYYVKRDDKLRDRLHRFGARVRQPVFLRRRAAAPPPAINTADNDRQPARKPSLKLVPPVVDMDSETTGLLEGMNAGAMDVQRQQSVSGNRKKWRGSTSDPTKSRLLSVLMRNNAEEE